MIALTRGRTVALLVALAALPWSVQSFAGAGATLRFAWGMASTDPPAVSFLGSYLSFARAPLVFSWALSAGLYALATVAAVVAAATGRRNPRLVAGLLVLAGLANAAVDLRFGVQPGRVAYPVGSPALWAVAWVVGRGE